MNATMKEELTAAFEYFGPAAIERGMRAFPRMPFVDREVACGCIRGYMGTHATEPGIEDLVDGFSRTLSNEAGAEAYEHFVALEDAYEGGHHDDLERLATEWLEAQRVVVPVFV